MWTNSEVCVLKPFFKEMLLLSKLALGEDNEPGHVSTTSHCLAVQPGGQACSLEPGCLH